MKSDFNIHEWQAKFLKEDTQYKMSSMEYLREELPHLYNADGDIQQSDIAYAMDEYAEYVSSFSTSKEI